MVRDQPLAAARALAEDLGADLVVGGEGTEAAVQRLLSSSVVDEPTTDMGGDIEALRTAMRRAELVRDRTRSRVAGELCANLNTGLAIHPATLQRAADELCAARHATARARAGRRPGVGRAPGVLRGGIGAGLVLGGLTVGWLGPTVIGAAVTVTGLVGGAASWWADRRSARRAVPGLDARQQLARRRWEQLAGPDADPTDVASVIRRYDPQQPVIADLLVHHPAVRAVDKVAALRRDAWVRAWRAEVGDLATPPVQADTSLGSTPTLAAEPAPARTVPAIATVVVAAPYADLSDVRARNLHRRLLRVPARCRVIVVLGPDLETRPVLDLTDGTRAVDVDLRDRGPVRTGTPS